MSENQIRKAGLLWFAGFNTNEIAKRLRLHESAIHSRIELIKIEAYLVQRVA